MQHNNDNFPLLQNIAALISHYVSCIMVLHHNDYKPDHFIYGFFEMVLFIRMYSVQILHFVSWLCVDFVCNCHLIQWY